MCHLIDIAVPGDSRVEVKENEKVQKYQDLARELRTLWQVKVKVVPVVVGALGTISKALEKHLKEIGTSVRVELLQKAALLRPGHNPPCVFLVRTFFGEATAATFF